MPMAKSEPMDTELTDRLYAYLYVTRKLITFVRVSADLHGEEKMRLVDASDALNRLGDLVLNIRRTSAEPYWSRVSKSVNLLHSDIMVVPYCVASPLSQEYWEAHAQLGLKLGEAACRHLGVDWTKHINYRKDT